MRDIAEPTGWRYAVLWVFTASSWIAIGIVVGCIVALLVAALWYAVGPAAGDPF
jgi:hypothetical protein